ncbi:hypothetical protein GQ42DRAFT_152263 [Ramicandelaber brevisporus]|nr:hypothetical protein GQ42DRAFT_152263 [Ramicandelaber brevisporus]
MRIHVASALFAALSLVAGQLEYHPLSGELELVKLPSHKAHKIHTVHSRAAATAHFDADAQEKQIIADFEHDFSAVLKRRQVPGMMYTVVRQNKTIAASGLGVADMNNPDSKLKSYGTLQIELAKNSGGEPVLNARLGDLGCSLKHAQYDTFTCRFFGSNTDFTFFSTVASKTIDKVNIGDFEPSLGEVIFSRVI